MFVNMVEGGQLPPLVAMTAEEVSSLSLLAGPGASFDFGQVTLGPPGNRRRIFAVLYWAGAGTITGASLGGVPLDIHIQATGIAILSARVGGFNGTERLLVDFSASVNNVSGEIIRAVDGFNNSLTATAVDTSVFLGALSTSIDVGAQGMVLAAVTFTGGLLATGISWLGLSELLDLQLGALLIRHGSACDDGMTEESNRAMSATSLGNLAGSGALIAVSWR